MPCACLLPPEVYPDAGEWGPILWSILHSLAMRAGRCAFSMYHGDERRAWISFFKAVGKMIPCPSCKDHYDSYLKENPVDATLKDAPYQDLNDYIQRWFWELHNWVNESYGKPVFPFEDLESTYRGVNTRDALKRLNVPMERAIRVRGGQLLGYREFTKWAVTLFSLYGI